MRSLSTRPKLGLPTILIGSLNKSVCEQHSTIILFLIDAVTVFTEYYCEPTMFNGHPNKLHSSIFELLTFTIPTSLRRLMIYPVTGFQWIVSLLLPLYSATGEP